MSIRQTQCGLIRGVPGRLPGVEIFKGIPFAQPPKGALRFCPPQPPQKWEGIYEADRYAPVAWQQFFDPDSFYGNEFYRDHDFVCDEDCLYLNVFTPEKMPETPLPVFVWIHGGAFMHGNSHEKEFDGETFVQKGVVYVSIQYRTGALGFLTHPQLEAESEEGVSGNYGILDQIAALTWVRDNIASFGGDPKNVTVAGQSAGCMSVQCLLHSRKAQGLFHRAVLQSGYGLMGQNGRDYTREGGLWAAEQLMKKAGCTTIEDLRAMEPGTLKDLWYEVNDEAGRMCWVPHVDGVVIEDSMLQPDISPLTDVDILIGSTGDDIGCDDGHLLRQGAVLFAHNSLQNGRKPAYVYYFDRKLPGDTAGAFHTAEVWYEFGTLSRCWRPMTAWDYTLSDMMSSYFTNFVRTGNPNGEGLPHWPPYTKEEPAEMLLADTVEVMIEKK